MFAFLAALLFLAALFSGPFLFMVAVPIAIYYYETEPQ